MKFRVTSPYGALEEFREKAHTGIDLGTPMNTILESPTRGVVEKLTNYDGNIGKGIIIRTEDGERLIFGHLSEFKVKLGQFIERGQEIGLTGNTGNSTGPHLHIGLKHDGMFVDPSKYVDIINAEATLKHFILQKTGPLTHFLSELIGFDFRLNELFFLFPACILFMWWLMTKVGGRWVLPLLYAYGITEVLE